MPPDAAPWTVSVGALPLGAAVLPDGSAVYIANDGPGANSLSVIDLHDRTAPVAPIAVGKAPWGVAVAPDGKRVYVTNSGFTTLSIVDTKTRQQTQAVPVGRNPQGVAVSADEGWTVFVANSGTGAAAGSVSVVDVHATPAVELFKITVGMAPAGLALTPDGRLYVAETGSNRVSVIDTSASPPALLTTVAVGAAPHSVAASDDGSRVYVTNRGEGTVSVLNNVGDPPGEMFRITVGPLPAGIAVALGSARVHVAISGADRVATIGTRDHVVIGTSPVGRTPAGVAMTPDGTAVLVTESGAGTVSAIATGDVALGDTVGGLAVSPDGSRLYAACDDSLLVLDLTSKPPTVAHSVAVAGTPFGVAVTPDGARVIVTQLERNTASVVDVSNTPVIGPEVTVGLRPRAVAIRPHGRSACVVNAAADTVSILDLRGPTPVVAATVPVGHLPDSVAITPDGRRAYVTATRSTLPGAPPDQAVVTVIDLTTDPPTVLATLPVGTQANGVAVGPDGRRAYVATGSGDTVTVIDNTTAPPAVLPDPIRIGGGPQGVAVTPDGSRLVVTQGSSSGICAVDLTRDRTVDSDGTDPRLFFPASSFPGPTVVAPDGTVLVANPDAGTLSVLRIPPLLPTGNRPERCALSPDRSRLVVADYLSGTLTVIGLFDWSAGTPWSVPVDPYPSAIAMLPDGRVLVASLGTDTVRIVDLRAGASVAPPVPVGASPRDLAVSPDSHTAYVACMYSGVDVVDLTGAQPVVIATIPTPTPRGVAVSSSRLWVTSLGNDALTAVDISADRTGTTQTTLPTGEGPGRPGLSPDGRTLYVANSGSASITVVRDGAVPAVVATAAAATDRPVLVRASPSGDVLHVLHAPRDEGEGGIVAHLDATTFRPLRIDQVGLNPTDLAVDPVDGTLYVTNSRSGCVSVHPPHTF